MDSSFYGMGWMTQRQKRCFCYDFFFLRQKPTRWGEFTFQLETSSFLSKEKTRSKTFSTFEFNMVVEALAFQKYSICWVFRSYSVQPHFQCKLKSSRVQRRQQIADVRTRLNLRNQPAANLPLSQRLSVDRSTECLKICPQDDPLFSRSQPSSEALPQTKFHTSTLVISRLQICRSLNRLYNKLSPVSRSAHCDSISLVTRTLSHPPKYMSDMEGC